ncbi:hypothetical protein CL652_02240 [bacterium]|nr:hypothetical protein [bacterium]|tara:strand:- start:4227 stop:5993 length:1767 start_codon:yes stop_codon:yes gene_type:complete
MDTEQIKRKNYSAASRLLREYEIPKVVSLQRVIRSLSPFERVVFWMLTTALVLSTFAVFTEVNREATTQVPVQGGVIREGVIGAPRFINPLLALSDTDRDLTTLIYAGLTRPAPDGTLIPDVAERYTISEDGTEYNFVLRDDARFHDGVPLTADDVVFTVQMAQDASIKSPRRADWDGVKVEKINDREVRFVLDRPYAPFLENTTMGILPRHIWRNVSPQEFAFSNFNTQPVGSGPFKLKQISYNSSGIPKSYDLRPFGSYTLGRPYINKFVMNFYANENELVNAYTNGEISSLSAVSSAILDKSVSDSSSLLRVAFPRIFAIFFNQNKSRLFADKEVRRALDVLIDKERIVQEVLSGYGTIIDSPIPPGTVTGQTVEASNFLSDESRRAAAQEILTDAGWTFDEELGMWTNGTQPLTFSIATANTPELKRAAQLAATIWTEAGIPVKVNVFETGELNQNVIRPRDYEALLFGEVVGRGLDLFAFWHSSQKDDPGLNIAIYTNSTVDDILAKARTVSDRNERDELYLKFEEEIQKDVPAIFLYAPDFLYVIPKYLRGVNIGLVETKSERFSGAYLWHTQTERVWYFFQ